MDSETAGAMQRGPGGCTKLGWGCKRGSYACSDKRCIEVPHGSANVRDLGKTKIVLRNRIAYAVGEGGARATVSGVEFSR